MFALSIILQEEAASPGLFSLNLGVSFWTVVIFLILMWALVKFAFPPILGYANAREERIREMMESARRDREEAQKLVAEQRERIEEARDEAQRIVAESKTSAETVRTEVLEKARREHEEMLTRARSEIEREREQAIDALRREAVELALAASSKLLGKKVDSTEDRRFVSDVIGRIGDDAKRA